MRYDVICFTIFITILAYAVSRKAFIRFKNPLLNPVFLSTVTVIGILLSCDLTFDDYLPGKEIMTFLLGPATVALAVPLYRHKKALASYAFPILVGVAVGSLSTMTAVVLVGKIAQLSQEIVLSLTPTSVTAPIAVEISRIIGGDASLTTAFVVATGMIGSIIGPLILNMLRVANPIARGLAMGTTSHGQGTAMALLEGELQGAMSGIAMTLAAVFTSVVAPYYVTIFPAG